MDDDLGGRLGAFDRQQVLNHLFLFGTGLAGIDLNDLGLVATGEKRVGLDEFHQLPGVCGIAGDDQDEGFDDAFVELAGVGFQLDLHAFVQADAVLQLHKLDLLGRHAGGAEILAGDDGRFLHKAIGHGAGQRVVEDDVFERHRTLVGLDVGGGG